MNQNLAPTCRPAATITRAASQHTYYTIRCLVDPPLIPDAYRAYAYFRWVDDRLDQGEGERSARLAFVKRQAAILNDAYQGEPPSPLTIEERWLVELIQRDSDPNSGLQAYLRYMMAVMAFDAERRGRLISQAELTEYSGWLATAVTEALHYFIGHHCRSPHTEARYLAVTAAHITHMLRDTFEDVGAGYYNIPREYLEAHHLTPQAVDRDAYRAWVIGRVQLARAYFKAGRGYLTQVEHPRCRLAGYAYTIRFEAVLDAIEREDYRLQPAYPEGVSLAALSRLMGAVVGAAFPQRAPERGPRFHPVRQPPHHEP